MKQWLMVSLVGVLSVTAVAGELSTDGYRIALPHYVYRFPQDEGSHDDYKTEWWYYTGHLFATDHREWGYELTFFRVATVPAKARQSRSRWFPAQLYLAHLALTDVNGHTFQYWEKLNRHGLGVAGAEPGHLKVWNDGWSATQDGTGTTHLLARQGAVALDLHLHSSMPPVIHGTDGISKKGPGVSNASHYYSMTRMQTSGTLSGQPVNGVTWMDHEFGSSQLAPDQVGWDWYALQLDDRTELMLYRMRNPAGQADEYSSGTLVEDGKVTPLHAADFTVQSTGSWTSPHTHGVYPMGWRIDVPAHHLTATVSPLVEDQELMTRDSTGVTYWEGASSVAATRNGTAVPGRAYVEMTGYAGRVHI